MKAAVISNVAIKIFQGANVSVTNVDIENETLNYVEGQGRSQEFAKGDKRGGVRDGSPSAGSRGRAPVGVWGQSPLKPETHAEYSTGHIAIDHHKSLTVQIIL